MKSDQPTHSSNSAMTACNQDKVDVKKAYTTPKLICHGTLQEKTLNGAGGVADGPNYS